MTLSLVHFLPVFLIVTIFCTTTYATINQHEYIIEFASFQQTESFLENRQHDIARIRHIYDSDILTGAAVEFKDEKVAKKLVFHYPGIIKAWPVHHRMGQQAPTSFREMNSTSVHKNKDADRNNQAKNDAVFVPQNSNTISLLTHANNQHKNLKSNGQGIKVGIIDSGVDYTLPALGGCFGEGCKVAYGYDLVGNNFNGSSSSIQESNDPIDNCPANSTSATGHGTFITGIIAAEDKQFNWTGVSPGVEIGMWKVYGCNYSMVPNDIVIKAMEMAYKAKMDIISISNGASGGWEEDVLSVVADRLVAKGIHVIVASGNIGSSGILLTASPATGRNVIAAGSTQNNFVPGFLLKLYEGGNTTNQTVEIPYRTYVNLPLVLNTTLPIIATSKQFNAKNDACENLIDESTTHHNNKYKGTIALIHDGGCDSLLKISHARVAGAKAVVIYTDVKNATTSFETPLSAVLPVAFINNDDGKTIFDSKGSKAQLTNILIALKAPPDDIDSISSFSSVGPTNELQLKPELAAVGGNVFSTLPRYLKSYGFGSGTSFSTPFIAGQVALLLSNTNRDMKPDMVKSILMNFATQVREPISDIHYEDSPIRQGAGVVDVVQAIEGYEQFHVSPAKLSLNDTANFVNEHSITVFNHNNASDLTVVIGHLPSLTATGYSLANTSDFTPLEPVGLYARNNSSASVQFSKEKLVIPKGKSAQVLVRVQPPPNFKPESHALYGGFISIKSIDSHKEATIPYFGMIGDMKSLPILDRKTNPSSAAKYTFPSIGLADGSATVKPDQVGHFHIKKQNGSIVGGPYILARLLTGTPLLQFQVMDKHNQVIGDIPMDSTRYYVMRNSLSVTETTQAFYSWQWNGEYVSKDASLSLNNNNETLKRISSGQYRLKLKGLRVFGNRSKQEDWDEWVSPKLILHFDE